MYVKTFKTLKTDIITCISASPIGRDMILVIMYVKLFKTGVFNNVTMKDNFQYQISSLLLTKALHEIKLLITVYRGTSWS